MHHHWFEHFFDGSSGPDTRPLLRKLRVGVLVFYAITIAIALLAVVWLSYADYRDTLRGTERQAMALARSLNEHATRSFVSVEQAMENVAENLVKDGGLDRLDEKWAHERLKAKVELTPQIRAIIAINAQGILRAHGLEYPTRQVDLSDRGYFEYHRDHDTTQLRVGEPVISRTDYKWLIPLTMRLKNPDGSFGGVMLSGVDPAYYLGFYESLNLDTGTSVQVMRNDGLLLINFPLDISRLGQNVMSAGQGPLFSGQATSAFFREHSPTSGDRFVAQLVNQGDVPLIVRVSLDSDTVLMRFKTDTRLRIATATLVLLMLSLMLYLLLRQIDRVDASESRLRLTQFAVDESPDMVLWCTNSGQLRYANRQVSKASGRSFADLVTLNLREIFDAPELAWTGLETLLGDKPAAGGIETCLHDAAGRHVPVELTIARIANEAETYYCVTARDISERKASQQELRQHRDHLQELVAERTAEVRAMLDANPLAIALVIGSHIQQINPAFETLFGYSREALQQLPESTLFPSVEARELVAGQVQAGLQRGGTFRGEAELRRRDGSIFWAVLFARALITDDPERGVVIIIEDVSAQRAAAQSLRQSEQLKRSVLDAMTDSFALIDRERRFVDVNQALSLQVGLHRSMLIGQTPESIWGEAQGQLLFPPLDETVPAASQQEVTLPVRSGERHPFQVSYGVIPDEYGTVAYRFAFFADISRQKQIASSLLDAKEAAEAASQAKSSFLANMSHELRTPMHAILSFSEMGLLKVRDGAAADFERYFEHIQKAGNRLLTLLNDLLDLSRLDADRMTYDSSVHSLQATVQAAINEVSSLTTARGIEIRLLSAETGLSLRYDQARLTQVLINLLSNAIRFSPEGGRIDIQLLTDGSLGNGKPAAGLSIRDMGPGIPPEDLRIIFDAFEQGSQPRSGGSGLGLAISQRIIRDHGGEISAANHPEGGALFTLLLPL
ncbi:PAS domain S-box protein [Uliginosibacterium paludis]|uniref:histidine kinase n=1 Tax=Uliginosibacterium paludis TaxID=1615952 RepID=A0ABV2CVE3_9RHOO